MKFLKVTSVNLRSGKEEQEIIRIDLIGRVWAFDGAAKCAAKAVLTFNTDYGTETIYISQTVNQVFQRLQDV